MVISGLIACSRSVADVELRAADVGRAVEDLPLQVAEIHDIEVDDAERADAGGGQVHRHRRTQAAGADAQHLGRFQLALTVHADFRHDEVPAVALDLVVGQLRESAFRRVRLIRRARLKADAPFRVGRRRSAACDRRDDADGVAGLHGRLLLLQIPDVVVVDVDVDEAAQLPLVVVEMRLEAACFAVRSASSSPTVLPSASTASFLSVNGRSGVGIRILVAIELALFKCRTIFFQKPHGHVARLRGFAASAGRPAASVAATATMMYANVGHA